MFFRVKKKNNIIHLILVISENNDLGFNLSNFFYKLVILSAQKVTKTLKSAPIGALWHKNSRLLNYKKTKQHLNPVFFVGLEKCSKAKTLLKVWGKKTFMVEIMDIEFA